MVRDNFAVFILAHGRPERLFTVNSLKKQGYTGKYYILIDDEDTTVDGYKKLFGEEHVVVFSKTEASKKFDVMDNFPKRNTVVWARNVCNDVARSLGLKYFAEFEDDYMSFTFRVPQGDVLRAVTFKHGFDDVVEVMLDFVDEISAVQPKFRTIAWAQSGEMMGGTKGRVWRQKVKRKAMNTFFFKVPDDPADDVHFIGRMNDDVNAYTTDGRVGGLWFQVPFVNLNQMLTQKAKGGNTDAYLKFGTYTKSFYSVMLRPDCTKIATMGETHKRVHHNINWELAVPKIINERYKKC